MMRQSPFMEDARQPGARQSGLRGPFFLRLENPQIISRINFQTHWIGAFPFRPTAKNVH